MILGRLTWIGDEMNRALKRTQGDLEVANKTATVLAEAGRQTQEANASAFGTNLGLDEVNQTRLDLLDDADNFTDIMANINETAVNTTVDVEHAKKLDAVKAQIA